MKFIMPSDIVPAASIVSHCHSSFSRAITISHFPSSGGKEVRLMFRQEEKPDTEVCMVKPLQVQKWASFIWSLANGVKVSSRHLRLQKLDKLLHWECSTIHHEFGDCYFLCPQLQLRYSSTTLKNPCSERMRLRLRKLVVLSWGQCPFEFSDMKYGCYLKIPILYYNHTRAILNP